VTDDQQIITGLVVNHRHRLGIGQVRSRQQRCHFRRRLRTLLRPSGRLADIDEADRRLAAKIIMQGRKQRRLLGAGHQQIVAAFDCGLEGRDMLPAQGIVHARLAGFAQRSGNGLAVHLHGAVAIAQQSLVTHGYPVVLMPTATRKL